MSDPSAIPAVTRIMQRVMSRNDQGDQDVEVTLRSPDRAATDSGERVNLFLFHATPNLNWRNMEMPPSRRSGSRGTVPLALNLHYLITAYGDDNNEERAQLLLGSVMARLHDFPVISKQAIDAEPIQELGGIDQQFEKIKITPEPLSIEEMTRLWSTFQTQYRVSAAYQASVLLIESTRPVKTALPVAKRGKFDRGVYADVGMGPYLESIEYRADTSSPKMPAAGVNDTITIVGTNLPNDALVVIRDPKQVGDNLVARIEPTIQVNGERLLAEMDRDQAIWPSGVLELTIEYQKVLETDPTSGETESRNVASNSLPLVMAPQLQTSSVDDRVVSFLEVVDDQKILAVSLLNQLGPSRKTIAILNRFPEETPTKERAYYQLPVLPDDTGLGQASPRFDVSGVPDGVYWIRIRVDGVDSLLVRRVRDTTTGRFKVDFDPKQKVVIK